MKVYKGLLFFVALPICIGFVLHTEILSRPQASTTPLRFEAATIKPYPPGTQPEGSVGGFCRGVDTPRLTSVPLGHCTFTFMTLKQLMLQAFPPTESLVTADNVTSGNGVGFKDVSARTRIMFADGWVTGGPGWIGTDYFELDAKAEDPSTTTQDQLREMLRTFVRESFKLEFEMQPKEIPGYFLVAAKGGAKLQPATDPPPTQEALARKRSSGITPFSPQQGTLAQLALNLTLKIKSPVIDTINTPDKYDFSPLDGVDFGGSIQPDADAAVGSIFSVLQEKLGLKLESHKIPVKIFVIKNAEKPSSAGH
jgi:uncharacterized protein (TIGR03435 family)